LPLIFINYGLQNGVSALVYFDVVLVVRIVENYEAVLLPDFGQPTMLFEAVEYYAYFDILAIVMRVLFVAVVVDVALFLIAVNVATV
jgi:hypothetical protein